VKRNTYGYSRVLVVLVLANALSQRNRHPNTMSSSLNKLCRPPPRYASGDLTTHAGSTVYYCQKRRHYADVQCRPCSLLMSWCRHYTAVQC